MTAPPEALLAVAPARPRSVWRTASFWLVAAAIVLGVFAPLLANDVPLAARVRGQWSFPAFADLFGTPPTGPDDLSWKQWWSRRPANGKDFALMPPWSFGPTETDTERFRAPPDALHWLGCDDSGRDVLARLLHGLSTVVWIGLPAVLLGAFFGTFAGAWAALRAGWADVVVLRLIELCVCVPSLLLLIFVGAFFGDSRLALVVVMASLFWTSFARIVRGEFLSLRERDFVHVARGLGVPERRMLSHHLLPQVKSQVGVTAAFCMASAVVAESTLSFLGLGPGDAGSSWGTMLRQGGELAVYGAWHLWLFPTIAIVTVVVACHMLADRLRASMTE
ncbi:MAG: ABC transporter permease [Planctomycetota bacterium]